MYGYCSSKYRPNKYIRVLSIELPAEIVSKILCSNNRFLFASITVSKDIREYSLQHFIRNSTISKLKRKDVISLDPYVIMKISSCNNTSIISYIQYAKYVTNDIKNPYIPAINETIYFVSIRQYIEIIYDRLRNMFDVNIAIMDTLVKEYYDYIARILPKSSYLLYKVIDDYDLKRDGDFNKELIYKYVLNYPISN